MVAGLRSRLLALVALAALGAGLAVVGTSLAGGQAAAGAPGTAFVVSEDNVSVASGHGERTLVENVSRAESIAIERVGAGRFAVRAEPPITDRERERARAILLGNETVRRALEAMGAYELGVEPIRKLNGSSAVSMSGNVTGTTDSDGAQEFRIENVTVRGESESVVLDRDASYVEDEASVRVRRPATGELRYTVHVDLANGTVRDVTDWEAIRDE
ncbi:hypothetical protein ACFQMA_01950 [Halosimplex aquaticum]|uniref:Uncharacterized protein n=1 Tax=Halosimplex aquaticum TaxID=3026162 RepID=A0ABD5XU14_9EURY|nr:hypothetical protein [Halosimplex aquaticum]